MNRILFSFLLFLGFLVAFSSARPLAFVSEQLGENIGLNNSFVGIALGWGTHVQGRNNFRFRVFGMHNILTEVVTGADLVWTVNGAKVATLKTAINQILPYYVGDVRFNSTVWNWLLNEQLAVVLTTAKNPNGTVGGAFVCRVHLGITVLSAEQVVPAPAVPSLNIGIGFSWIFNILTLANLDIDIVVYDQLIPVAYGYYAKIVYTVANATQAEFLGPANATQTGPVLAGLNTLNNFAQSNPGTNITTNFFQQDIGLTYLQVNSAKFPRGDIRGQIASLLSKGRRHIPYTFTTIYGNTDASSGLATLQHSNQRGFKNHASSYVTLQAQQLTPGSGNYTYQGVFNFYNGVNKKNLEIVRGIVLEVNMRQSGAVSSTWLIEFFNGANNTWIQMGTFTALSRQWTAAFLENFNSVQVWGMATGRGVQLVRLTTSSATPTSLLLDLFALRFFTPNVEMNTIIKSVVKVLPQLPTN